MTPADGWSASRPLPRLLVLTDRTMLPAGRDLISTLRAAVDGGARAVVLRERDLPTSGRARLADQVQALLSPVGGVLLLASDAPPEWTTRPGGLHLRSADPVPANRPALLGRSTHSVHEVLHAAAEGCDYVTLSPVAPTRSKPWYGPSLGVVGFSSVLAHARRVRPLLPAAFALGGVDERNATSYLQAGAGGVAVMGAVMRSPDPAQTVDALLALITVATPAAATLSATSAHCTPDKPSVKPRPIISTTPASQTPHASSRRTS